MKHFLSVADLTTEELWQVLNLACELKAEWQQVGPPWRRSPMP